MILKCPMCKSTNTESLGGNVHDNLHCLACGGMSIVTWQNYKELLERIETEYVVFCQLVLEIVPYVAATLSSCDRNHEGKDWGSVHRGRAESSMRIL